MLTWRESACETSGSGEHMASERGEFGFQAFGRFELYRALRAEIREAEKQLCDAADEEERARAQEKLNELRRERGEADKHGGEWLF
jgi:hypothetical protein